MICDECKEEYDEQPNRLLIKRVVQLVCDACDGAYHMQLDMDCEDHLRIARGLEL